MSGTSFDGVDAALMRTDGENYIKFKALHFYPILIKRKSCINLLFLLTLIF